MSQKPVFTVEDANRTLPLVRRIVRDVVEHHRVWREKILELDLLSASQWPEDTTAAEVLERTVQGMGRDLDGFQRELDQLGIQLKDRRQGLVDFPSEMDGRAVLLCWRLGEPEVQFWHEVDAGAAGRRPLGAVAVG